MVCRVIFCFGVLYFLLNTQDVLGSIYETPKGSENSKWADYFAQKRREALIRHDLRWSRWKEKELLLWYSRSSRSSSSRKLIGILNEVSADLPFAICTYDYNDNNQVVPHKRSIRLIWCRLLWIWGNELGEQKQQGVRSAVANCALFRKIGLLFRSCNKYLFYFFFFSIYSKQIVWSSC